MAEGDAAAWYFLVEGQPIGPYNVEALRGFFKSGHLNSESLFWKEGEPEWKPAAKYESLSEALHVKDPPEPTVAGPQAEQAKEVLPDDDPLAAFQAEIQAIEAENAVLNEEPASPAERSFVDDDGTWYLWDSSLKKFVAQGGAPPPGEAAYNPDDMVFEAEEEVIPTLQAVREAEAAAAAKALEEEKEKEAAGKKRKAQEVIDKHKERSKRAKEAAEADKNQGWFEVKNNTSVYATGLPWDVTVEEVAEVFSKCGIIKEDEKRQPRIKIYRDQKTGMPKGDCLVTYLKLPSVDLAISLLDGAPFRPGGVGVMSVSKARFEMKGETFVPKPKSKKSKKVLAAQEAKLLGWGGFDDKLPAEKVTVVLRHMFEPDELLLDPDAVEQLEVDVSSECTKLGPVDKVCVYKAHPQGVVSVRFRTEEAAQACITLMSGRWFGGRQIAAALWDGRTNFNVKMKETAEEQAARLEAYARELEGAASARVAASTGTLSTNSAGEELEKEPLADGPQEFAPAGNGELGPVDALGPSEQ